MVKVIRTSPLSGTVNHLEIDMTDWAFAIALAEWHSGVLIQDAFPTLSADEREFIKTGITPAEWDNLFSKMGA